MYSIYMSEDCSHSSNQTMVCLETQHCGECVHTYMFRCAVRIRTMNSDTEIHMQTCIYTYIQ